MSRNSSSNRYMGLIRASGHPSAPPHPVLSADGRYMVAKKVIYKFQSIKIFEILNKEEGHLRTPPLVIPRSPTITVCWQRRVIPDPRACRDNLYHQRGQADGKWCVVASLHLSAWDDHGRAGKAMSKNNKRSFG
ncbi:hypothetical protein E2C01_098170 [Portunus trituberculatus]|uniref:Uncharacterized protein n=1 Tax=Portunus trituberculatus TaxID=210409 RepID=A0A5B7K6E8_PORTR|nr:hypothetical protein [Portunus trituberculatus]